MKAIALVTGASGGIGHDVARQFHAQGCLVATVGRDAGRLADVEATQRIAADTTTPEGAVLAITACQEALGAAPTLLAHCVGSTLIAPLHRTRADAYREVMRVNLDSAMFMLQAWVEGLRVAAQPGAAVLASSVVARIGVANHEALFGGQGRHRGPGAQRSRHLCAAGPARQCGGARHDRNADDRRHSARGRDARRRRQAVPTGWGADCCAGGRCDGLAVVGRSCPHYRSGDCRGRRVYHRAPTGQVTSARALRWLGVCQRRDI